MPIPTEKKGRRGVFDVRRAERRGFLGAFFGRLFGFNVLNLRPKFFVRKPLASLGLTLVVGIIVFLGARQLFTRAEVADFFPAACLGDWDNPQLAQGEPESFGDDTVAPALNNSAIYDSGKATSLRIFCGKFVPDDFEATGEIKNVGLTLVWRVGERVDSASSPQEETPQEETSDTGQATSSPQADSVNSAQINSPPADSTSSVETILPPAETTPTQQNLEQATTTSWLDSYNPLSWILKFALAQESTEELTQEPTQEPSPPEETVLQPQGGVDSARSTSSVQAGSPRGDPTVNDNDNHNDSSSIDTAILASPIEIKLEPIETGVTSDEVQATSSGDNVTGSGDIASQFVVELPPPPPPDENFLKISYSVNGNDWFELSKINPQNWQNFTVPVSVTTWDELESLQIKIEGIETSLADSASSPQADSTSSPQADSTSSPQADSTSSPQADSTSSPQADSASSPQADSTSSPQAEIPKVYLDGMFVEVIYEIPAPITIISLDEDSLTQNAAEELDSAGRSGSMSSPQAEKEKIKIFDEGAKHKCSVEPFSQSVKSGFGGLTTGGESAVYRVSLRPSFENSYFELLTGDLPTGVSAVFDPERGVGTSTPKLTLTVGLGAGRASFDTVIIYKEIDKNFNTMANFCQLNLIIE